MKNKEKYPNTDDAVKAYEEHKKECNCDCTFEDWLDLDDDKLKERMNKLDGLFAASLFGPIGRGLLVSLKLKQADSEKLAEPTADKSKSGDIECPLCHGKRGYFRAGIFTDFYCPDCDALIYKRTDVERAPFDSSSPDEFKSWLDKFTSAAKKD